MSRERRFFSTLSCMGPARGCCSGTPVDHRCPYWSRGRPRVMPRSLASATEPRAPPLTTHRRRRRLMSLYLSFSSLGFPAAKAFCPGGGGGGLRPRRRRGAGYGIATTPVWAISRMRADAGRVQTVSCRPPGITARPAPMEPTLTPRVHGAQIRRCH